MKEPLEKQLENAYKIFKNDHERLREKLMDSIDKPQMEYEPEPEQSLVAKRKSSGPSLGEIIMDSRIFKIAAGIIIVGIVAIALKIFTGTNTVTSVAFGDVLKQIHGKSYTFDITTIVEGETQSGGKSMMLQPGLARFDNSQIAGGITSIANYNTKESFLIYHGQKVAMKLSEIPGTENIPEDTSPLLIFTNPIENLWNLQDGTQTSLGEKEIDGQPVIGFKVKQEKENYSGDVVVWANSQTGTPIIVEINLYNPEDSSESITMIFDNFNLDVELDPELFSMKTPEGYTLAYQNTLDETVSTAELTPEADKIQQSIELWSSDQEDKAVETLLSVDWTQPFDFSGDMYFFYLKEKEYVQLKQEDQQKVSQEIMDMSSLIRKLCFKIWEDAQAAITNKEYETAEKYLTTTLELGRLINRDPEITLNVKMIAHALIQKSLSEMEKLYQATGEQEKLQKAQQEMQEIKAEHDRMVEQISQM
ncbi:MAG: hypothetical protein JXA96_12100 [Sedimentisphaerales bacterium]|nr:hypothetical protein [Sedimentisphaerales bacterium]